MTLKPCSCKECNGKLWPDTAFYARGTVKTRTRDCFNRDNRAAYAVKKASKGEKKYTDLQKWLCYCATCERDHIREIYWTGKKVNPDGSPYRPRKMCLTCKRATENLVDTM